MKNPLITIVIALLAAVLGGWIGSQLDRGGSRDEVAIADTGRIGGIVRRIDGLEDALRGFEKRALARDAGEAGRARSDGGVLEELARLRAEVAALKAAPGEPGPMTASRSDAVVLEEDAGTIAAIVDERIAQAAEERLLQELERKREAAQALARRAARRRAAEYAKELVLTEDQTERLGLALSEEFASNLPLYGSVKDQGSVDDRRAAIMAIRSNWRALDDAARGLMSSAQFEQYRAARDRDIEKTSTWLDNVEVELAGG